MFNVAWHPHFNYILASGSDDKTIRVWDIKNNGSKVLTGHSSNVRALSWNTEIPWFLSSGSWDMSIRVWDIRSNQCVYVLTDHHADVYGLTFHPERPFIYASASRDTSIRLWSVFDNVKLKILVNQKWTDILGDPHDSMQITSELRLCGEASRALFDKVSNNMFDSKFQMRKALHNFVSVSFKINYNCVLESNTRNRRHSQRYN